MRDTGKRAREIETHRGARGRCRDTDERKVEIGRHSEREKERLRDTVERETESIWAVAPLMEVGCPIIIWPQLYVHTHAHTHVHPHIHTHAPDYVHPHIHTRVRLCKHRKDESKEPIVEVRTEEANPPTQDGGAPTEPSETTPLTEAE